MNNRQANGRRRGRGGQRPQGGNPSQGNGNRIDNRARGNAAQLLEKYRNLARDAQMQGDRVNAEYYFQFADHYFRVLSETRSRFEENQQRQRPQDDDEFDYEDEGFRADEPRGQEGREQRQDARQDAYQNEGRENNYRRDARPDDRPDRGNRQDGRQDARQDGRQDGRQDARRDRDEYRANGHVNGNGGYHPEAQPEAEAEPAERREPVEEGARRRRGRPRRDEVRAEAPAASSEGIDVAVLPPAFGIEAIAPVAEKAEDKPKPRRGRRPKSEEAPAT